MEGTFQTGSIVAGVDGSASGNFALKWAIERASAHGRPMHLVHALAPDLPSQGFGMGLDEGAVRSAGLRLLQAATARVHANDRSVPVSSSCVNGFASRALVNASHRARMVVVGAHGFGGGVGGRLGGVALQVATHASCPVVVIRHGDTGTAPFGRVVAGVDGSAPSLLALRQAFEQAELRDAELIVLHAWHPERTDDPTLATGSDWPAYEQAQETLVNHTIAEERSAHPDVKVTQEIVPGNPAKLLLDRSAEADLIVVGDRGSGGFDGLLLGSVAGRVLDHSNAPVLVARKRPA